MGGIIGGPGAAQRRSSKYIGLRTPKQNRKPTNVVPTMQELAHKEAKVKSYVYEVQTQWSMPADERHKRRELLRQFSIQPPNAAAETHQAPLWRCGC